MKKIALIIIAFVLITQYTKAQTVVLDTNGVTLKWTGTTVPNPRFVQASPRGTLEWFAIVDNSERIYIHYYAMNYSEGIAHFTPPGNTTPIPFNNIVTTLVTDMSYLFNTAYEFNQPIDSWDVSNVGTMGAMFIGAQSFNQPIGNWDVSNVTNMSVMFNDAIAFNQPIGSWDVSNLDNMSYMFQNADSFNQPIENWNVGNVIYMGGIFYNANTFNQPIGNWDVSNVNFMYDMFANSSFNQPIGSWNISNVTDMTAMFLGAQLSTANYDATLIGWATIEPNETPLKPNVIFWGGNSNYCNGESARNSIIQNYGWTITDAGLNCSGLDTETFDTMALQLYPNPVLNVINVKIGSDYINQSYTIVDGVGRIILNGYLHETESNINVEQLSKGIYYFKLQDSRASKFIKE
jgi:surface protein